LARHCDIVDIVDKDWLVIVKKNPRDLYKMPEQNGRDVNSENEEDEAYQQLESDLNVFTTTGIEFDTEVPLHRHDIEPQSISHASEHSRTYVSSDKDTNFINDTDEEVTVSSEESEQEFTDSDCKKIS